MRGLAVLLLLGGVALADSDNSRTPKQELNPLGGLIHYSAIVGTDRDSSGASWAASLPDFHSYLRWPGGYQKYSVPAAAERQADLWWVQYNMASYITNPDVTSSIHPTAFMAAFAKWRENYYAHDSEAMRITAYGTHWNGANTGNLAGGGTGGDPDCDVKGNKNQDYCQEANGDWTDVPCPAGVGDCTGGQLCVTPTGQNNTDQHCLGGANDGLTCTTDANCTGGRCQSIPCGTWNQVCGDGFTVCTLDTDCTGNNTAGNLTRGLDALDEEYCRNAVHADVNLELVYGNGRQGQHDGRLNPEFCDCEFQLAHDDRDRFGGYFQATIDYNQDLVNGNVEEWAGDGTWLQTHAWQGRCDVIDEYPDADVATQNPTCLADQDCTGFSTCDTPAQICKDGTDCTANGDADCTGSLCASNIAVQGMKCEVSQDMCCEFPPCAVDWCTGPTDGGAVCLGVGGDKASPNVAGIHFDNQASDFVYANTGASQGHSGKLYDTWAQQHTMFCHDGATPNYRLPCGEDSSQTVACPLAIQTCEHVAAHDVEHQEMTYLRRLGLRAGRIGAKLVNAGFSIMFNGCFNLDGSGVQADECVQQLLDSDGAMTEQWTINNAGNPIVTDYVRSVDALKTVQKISSRFGNTKQFWPLMAQEYPYLEPRNNGAGATNAGPAGNFPYWTFDDQIEYMWANVAMVYYGNGMTLSHWDGTGRGSDASQVNTLLSYCQSGDAEAGGCCAGASSLCNTVCSGGGGACLPNPWTKQVQSTPSQTFELDFPQATLNIGQPISGAFTENPVSVVAETTDCAPDAYDGNTDGNSTCYTWSRRFEQGFVVSNTNNRTLSNTPLPDASEYIQSGMCSFTSTVCDDITMTAGCADARESCKSPNDSTPTCVTNNYCASDAHCTAQGLVGATCVNEVPVTTEVNNIKRAHARILWNPLDSANLPIVSECDGDTWVDPVNGNDSWDCKAMAFVSGTIGPCLTFDRGINQMDNDGTLCALPGTFSTTLQGGTDCSTNTSPTGQTTIIALGVTKPGTCSENGTTVCTINAQCTGTCDLPGGNIHNPEPTCASGGCTIQATQKQQSLLTSAAWPVVVNATDWTIDGLAIQTGRRSFTACADRNKILNNDTEVLRTLRINQGGSTGFMTLNGGDDATWRGNTIREIRTLGGDRDASLCDTREHIDFMHNISTGVSNEIYMENEHFNITQNIQFNQVDNVAIRNNYWRNWSTHGIVPNGGSIGAPTDILIENSIFSGDWRCPQTCLAGTVGADHPLDARRDETVCCQQGYGCGDCENNAGCGGTTDDCCFRVTRTIDIYTVDGMVIRNNNLVGYDYQTWSFIYTYNSGSNCVEPDCIQHDIKVDNNIMYELQRGENNSSRGGDQGDTYEDYYLYIPGRAPMRPTMTGLHMDHNVFYGGVGDGGPSGTRDQAWVCDDLAGPVTTKSLAEWKTFVCPVGGENPDVNSIDLDDTAVVDTPLFANYGTSATPEDFDVLDANSPQVDVGSAFPQTVNDNIKANAACVPTTGTCYFSGELCTTSGDCIGTDFCTWAGCKFTENCINNAGTDECVYLPCADKDYDGFERGMNNCDPGAWEFDPGVIITPPPSPPADNSTKRANWKSGRVK